MLEQQQRRRKKRKKKQERSRSKKRGEQEKELEDGRSKKIVKNKKSKNILQWRVVNAKKIPPRSHTAHIGDTDNNSGDAQRRKMTSQDRGLQEELGGDPTNLYPRMNRGEHHWDLAQTTVIYVNRAR